MDQTLQDKVELMFEDGARVCVCAAPGGSDFLGAWVSCRREATPGPARTPCHPPQPGYLQCVPGTLLGGKPVELALVPPVALGWKRSLGPGLNPAG